ncbi:MAG: hypothetical protein ACLRT5_11990 [Lachnospiraceae bacterium]
MPWENSRAGQYGPDARKGKHYKTGYCTADKGMLRCVHGKPEHIEAACPPISGEANPPDERKEGDADGYIFGLDPDSDILIVSLIGLCYQIFREKK